MRLSWHNISLQVRDRGGQYKKILSNISGTAESGRMMVFMGPSGSGKTSLLKTLSCDVCPGHKTGGAVLLDGSHIPRNFMTYVSFLDQDSRYLGYYTVSQFLEINTAGRHRDKQLCEVRSEVSHIIEKFYLEKCRDTAVSKLSGGEMKRLLVANEILSDRPIMFLDEPTTGLDSRLALELIYILKKLAVARSKIVILTIHQPSQTIMRFVDDLCFIQDGKLVYSGPLHDCESFLAQHGLVRPSDIPLTEYLFVLSVVETDDPVIRTQSARFRALLESIPDSECSLHSSGKSILTAESALQCRLIPHLLMRQLRYRFMPGKGWKFVLKWVFMMSTYTVFLLFFYYLVKYSTRNIAKENNVLSHQLPKLNMFMTIKSFVDVFYLLMALLSTALLKDSLEEIEYNRMEVKKSYYAVNEFAVAVLLFQLLAMHTSVLLIFCALCFFLDSGLPLLFLRFFAPGTSLVVVQTLLFLVLAKSESVASCLSLVVFFGKSYERIKVFHRFLTGMRPLLRVFSLLLHFFPTSACEIYAGHSLNGAVDSYISDQEEGIRLVLEEFIGKYFRDANDSNVKLLKQHGIGLATYMRICAAVLLCMLLLAYAVLRRRLSSPTRLRLEKK